MSKNTFLKHNILSKTNLAVFFALCMIVGFLCSRVISSCAIFLFGMNAIRDVHPKDWFKQKWWLLGLVWIAVYAISWFWSADKEFWADRVQTKLPFLLLPLAFGFLPAFTKKQLEIYTVGLCLLLLSGVGYSMSVFLKSSADLIAGYGYSQLMPTPAYGDHISFSMALALAVVWCVYIFKDLEHKASKGIVATSILIFIVFLHILAAKTGLLGLYFFIFCWGLSFLWGRNRIMGLVVITVLIATAVLSFKYVETFNKRIAYSMYSYQQYKEGNISADYSDIGRILSYDVAIVLIKKHPLKGVGAGDILNDMGEEYKVRFPTVKKEQYLVPHNQFLTVAVGTGVISALFFTWWFFAPLSRIRKNREGFFFFVTWAMLLLLLCVDPTLEVQFGIFVVLFFLCWQRHTVVTEVM